MSEPLDLSAIFGTNLQPGTRYEHPELHWPECPPVGSVLAAEIQPGERPTVFVVGREDVNGRYLDETGGAVNQPWRDVLKRWGTLVFVGRLDLGQELDSDDANLSDS